MMTKHEQIWREFCEEHPTRDGGDMLEGFTDYLIERLVRAEAERDELKSENVAMYGAILESADMGDIRCKLELQRIAKADAKAY